MIQCMLLLKKVNVMNTVFTINVVKTAIPVSPVNDYSDSSVLRMRYGSVLISNRRGHVHKRVCHARSSVRTQ